jgi:SMI1 / KNR4 family (SUKH-1)
MPLQRNFFRQPVRGFNEKTRGRTAEEIEAFEARVGFKLPSSYADILRTQNGRGVHYRKIAGAEDFNFDGGFSSLPEEGSYRITNFREYILATCDEEELAVVEENLAPFFPNRMVLFAGLDGHSAAFLDYGYRLEEAVADPSVVFISDDKDDFLHFGEMGPRFGSFQEFLDALLVDKKSDDSTYIGITGVGDFTSTVRLLDQELDLQLETYVEDDANGNFDFAVWHSGSVPLELDAATVEAYANENGTTKEEMDAWILTEGGVRKIYSVLTPNQHRSGTYRYHDNPELSVVLEVRKSWFPMEAPVAGLVTKLREIPGIESVVFLP